MSYTILAFSQLLLSKRKVGLGSKSSEMWQGHTARLNLQVAPGWWELCHQILMVFLVVPWPHSSSSFMLQTDKQSELQALPSRFKQHLIPKIEFERRQSKARCCSSCRRLTPFRKTPRPRRTDRKGPCNCFCRLYLVQSSVVLVFVKF